MADALAETRRRGAGCAESTIRRMIISHLYAEATGPGVTHYAGLLCVGRGLYQLTGTR